MVCLVLVRAGLAQGWCKPGATWHYRELHLGPAIGEPNNYTTIDGVSDYRYVSDTVLNGITCNHITGTFRGKKNVFMAYTTFSNNKNYYSYQSNKVIFAWSPGNNSFDTIVNFNAAIGDKWLRNTLGGICNGRAKVTVVDTGRIFINAIGLKKIVTTYTNTLVMGSYTTTVSRTDTLIERLMNCNGFMFPMYCETNNPVVDHPTLIRPDFKCYEDNTFLLYKNTNYAKCEFDAVGIKENAIGRLNMMIYPNPAASLLRVESDVLQDGAIYQLALTNVLGQAVMLVDAECSGQSLELNLTTFDKGIYLLNISAKGQLLASEKLIKE